MSLTKLTLDFETYWAQDYSLSNRGMTLTKYIRDPRFKAHGVGIKIDNKPSNWVTHKDLPRLFAKIPWHKVMLIAHNPKFDASILAWIYGCSPALIVDTKGMARALLGNIPASFALDSVSAFLFGRGKTDGLKETKGVYDLPPDMEARLGGYCLNDVDLTYDICKMLFPYFPRREFAVLDWTIRMFTEPMLLLDKPRLLRHKANVLEHKRQLFDRLQGKYDRDIFTSNPKFAALLETLGVVPPTKVSVTTGKETFAFAKTDEDFLSLLEHPNPDIVAVVEARLGLKTSQAETRAQSYADHSDFGAWPVDIEYCGAVATHRFSGASGGGGNPQNLKRGSELRKSIYAPDGYIVVAGDLSAIELRVAMALAGQEDALEILIRGDDIYCWFAGVLYGRKITKENDPDERFLGKLACLSLQYGCGKDKFRKIAGLQGVKLSDQDAAEVVALYRRTFYRIPQIWQHCNNAILRMARGEEFSLPPIDLISFGRDKFLWEQKNIFAPAMFMPGGLTIRYFGLRRDSNEQWVYLTRTHRKEHETKLYGGKMFENACQSLARQVVTDNCLKLRKSIPIVMQVHDELVSVVPEDEAVAAKKLMLDTMSTPPVWWPGLPVSAEVKFHKSYGEAK